MYLKKNAQNTTRHPVASRCRKQEGSHTCTIWVSFNEEWIQVSKDGDIILLACSNVVLDAHRLQLVRSRHNLQQERIGSTGRYGAKSDVYALGMSLFELTTNKGFIGATRTQMRPITEQLPVQPRDIPSSSKCGDQFWLLLSHCWASNPQDRPDASTVVKTMETIDDIGLYGGEGGAITRPSFIHRGLSRVDLVQSITGHVCPTIDVLTVEPAPFIHGDITDVCAAEVRGEPALICPHIEGGPMPSYLQNAESRVDRCKMSAQIAEGVAYLHSIGIVHGNIQGSKMLVAEGETIKICDFYNAFLRHPSIHFMTHAHSYFSARWAAPELLNGILESSEHTDVWALGMTILECITGELPFSAIELEYDVINAVLEMKELPARPKEHIPPNSTQGDTLWSLLARCWAYEPLERPSAAEIRDIMKTVTLEGLVDSSQTVGVADAELDDSRNSENCYK
ncbi:kinase-like protein [Ceratobasidium sp. AG-I]|nr:kinase-like protein [Ceratobasidium sp. AG-I]